VGVGGAQALHGAQFLSSCCYCIIIALVVHQAGGAHQARASFVFSLSLSLSLSLSPQPNANAKKASKQNTHRGEITSLQTFAPCSSSITKSLTKFLGALYLLTSRLKMTAKFGMSLPEEV